MAQNQAQVDQTGSGQVLPLEIPVSKEVFPSSGPDVKHEFSNQMSIDPHQSTLKNHYRDKSRPELQKQFAFKSLQQVPRLEKVTLNMCVPQAVKNPKLLNSVAKDLSMIAGQKAVITKAKKAISNFKIKEGMPLGAMVTLRREKMWTFLERLIHFALPQVRDFRGLSPRGFDGKGNYNIGIKEQIIFPEVDYDKVDAIRGMNITICTTARDDKSACILLKSLGFPLRKT